MFAWATAPLTVGSLTFFLRGSEWVSIASIPSLVATVFLSIQSAQPWWRESSWHCLYWIKLDALRIELMAGADSVEIDRKRNKLAEEMSVSFPDWRFGAHQHQS